MSCPSCGVDSPVGARFCPSCGAPLVLRNDERRVVTVLFGDIVGFTGLSETLDPERIKNLVDNVFEQLAADIVSFGGEVDKIVGDGIVALFGAPIAHEDDAERAVRAALKMQETVRAFDEGLDAPIRMRIGVNTGEALVGALRADGEYTATGDAVNTASRLQSAAEPGGVLVGPLTHEHTQDVISYERVGPVQAKGREGLVEAWRAIAPLGRPGERRSRMQTRLFGRDLELSALRRALDTSLNLGRSQLLLILGEAGVGKTRLAEEVAQLARREYQALVLAGRCVPYGEANIWWPVAEALRPAVAVDHDLPLEEATAIVRNEIATVFRMPANTPEVERCTTGLLHLFDYETPLRSLDAQIATNEAGRAVRAFLQARSAHGPVVLWLADLHWADDVVLRLADALLTRLARAPFVLLSSARYSLDERWSPRIGRHNTLTLGLDPLDRAASDQLLTELLPADAPVELRAELLDRAGGNPFFLQELVALVGDEGRSVDHGELPSSVRGLVSARLDGLPDDERQVLEDAAVMGRRGGVAALARMGSQMRDIPNVPELVRNLRDRDLLLVDRDEWSFRSDVVRDITYARLTKTERARRHAGIAEYLVGLGEGARVDSIAYHYRRAAELVQELGRVPGMPLDLRERAVEWLERAASGSSARIASDVAARLYGQAFALLPPDDPHRTTVLLARAKALIDDRDLGAARRDIAEARAAAGGDPAVEAMASMRLAEIEQRSGNYDHAMALFEEAAVQFRRLGDTRGMAESLRNAGMAHLFSGHNDEAEAIISAALQAFQDAGDISGEAWSHQNLGWIAFVRGRLAQAERRVAKAVQLFDQVSDDGGAAWCQGLLSYVRLHQGRFEEADDLSQRAYTDAHERNDRWGEAMMIVVRASVRLFTGRTEAAVRRAEEAVSLFRTMTEPVGRLQAVALLGRALVLSGRVDEGFQVFADTEAPPAPARHEGVFALVRTAAATASVALGDPNEALRWVDPADVSWLDPSLVGHADRLVAIGLALAQSGRFSEAADVLELAGAVDADGAGHNPDALAALALVEAAVGGPDRVDELTELALSSQRVTYVDRLRLALAAAVSAAHRGDTDAAEAAMARARAEVTGTEDRVHDAVVALAAAHLLADPVARSTASSKLSALGVEMTGWRTLFDLTRTAPVAVG